MLRFTVLLVVLLLLGSDDAPRVGDRLVITVYQTGLKPSKSRLTKDLATLKEGDEIEVTSVEGLWLGAKSKELAGFVLANVVAPRDKVRLSAQSETSTVSVEDRTAAQKGFNPEVEKEYRRQKSGSLEQAFLVVDRIEGRILPIEDVAAFVGSGALGGGR